MPAESKSFLSRPDPRPMLVSILGGGWLLLWIFAALRAIIILAGLSGGIQVGEYDSMAAIAEQAPEFVDPAYLEAQSLKSELARIERWLAVPMILAAGLGIHGAVRLLRRQRRARAQLLVTGLVGILVTAIYFLMATRISLRPAENIVAPEGTSEMFYAVAGFNILMQSLPAILGLSLLRHPIVREYVTGRNARFELEH